MKREIKFRAWDGNEMIGPNDERWIGNFDDLYFKDISKIFDKDDALRLVWMQFTGLHDKNGKEIYEGDVVKGVVKFPQLHTWDTDENSNFDMAGVVFWDHTGFMLDCRNTQSMCSEDRDGMVNYFDFIGQDGQVFEEMEIIGNIYENPELLTNTASA